MLLKSCFQQIAFKEHDWVDSEGKSTLSTSSLSEPHRRLLERTFMVLGCTLLTVASGSNENERLMYKGLMNKLHFCFQKLSKIVRGDQLSKVLNANLWNVRDLTITILTSARDLKIGRLRTSILLTFVQEILQIIS